VELNKVYNEDCLIGMSRIADKSVDMILCDLPYGTTACKWDVIIPFEPLWEQYERVIKSKGNIILFGSGMFAYKLALSNESLFRYEMIWKKSKCGSPLTAKYMPLKKHENVLVFGKSAATYNPQKTLGKPYKRLSKKNVNNMGYGAGVDFLYGSIDGKRHPSTIIDIKQNWRRQDQIHPTQKPVALFEYLIKTYTNEGETVLDNCMGSGTTAIACINTNRNYIGFEKEEKYYQIIQDRIKKHTPQLKLIA
jgi:site-specific DNA-methyltransferase (adenine-specific)